MRIEHHGARDGVTGSCHQLHIDNDNSLLIDCGLFQGSEVSNGNSSERQQITFDVSQVRALVVTHVHIDHVGRIPWLLAAGFDGPIICSRPSAKLLPLVLEDAFKLGISRDRKLVEHYLKTIAERTLALPYNQWFSLVETADSNTRIRLQRAGHILGSAYVEIDISPCRSGVSPRPMTPSPRPGASHRDQSTRIVFSGDLGAPHTPILPEPQPPERADILVLESTYGDRNHENRATRKERLKAAIARALANGGTVLIPAFSIGRTQELLYELHEIGVGAAPSPRQTHPQGTMPSPRPTIPVILDSPLASKFTQAYRELKPYWDDEAQQLLAQGKTPLAFDTLLTVDSHDEHLKMVHHLASSGRPAIVIAGSGMCNAGRIVNYLKAMLGDERHDVLFVGYQAAGTPGRDIQQYGPKGGYVMLEGERIDIRARVETIGGYSAHADQASLVNFVTGIQTAPEEIRLIHGDPGAKQALKHALAAALPSASTRIRIP